MKTRRSWRNQNRLWKALGGKEYPGGLVHGSSVPRFNAANVEFVEESNAKPDRLFIGIFPGGISYADREREEDGDYKRLAFLPYRELVLDVERDCPAELRTRIEAHAAAIIARRGQQFQVSTCGQTVTLGTA